MFFKTPELAAGPESDALMRSAGARPMVTGYNSIWLSLGTGEEDLRAGLHGKWRNQLRTSEASGLKVRTSHGGANLEWLLSRHDAYRRRKRLRVPAARASPASW